MKRISFDDGKTFLDMLDESTGDIVTVVAKLRSRKNWDKLVSLFEPDAMMKAVDDLKIHKSLILNTAEARVMFLGQYLKYAQNDLVTKM